LPGEIVEYRDRWLLNLVYERIVKSKDTDGVVQIDQTKRFCYDDGEDRWQDKGDRDGLVEFRGLLTQEYTFKNPPSASDYDFYTDYNYSDESNLRHSEKAVTRGGDTNLYYGHNVFTVWYDWDKGVEKEKFTKFGEDNFYFYKRWIEEPGLVRKEQDANLNDNLAKKYEYDPLGRVTKTYLPGDSFIQIEYGDMDHLEVSASRSCEGDLMMWTYHYDSMGKLQKEVEQGLFGPDGTNRFRTRLYDHDHLGNERYVTEWVEGEDPQPDDLRLVHTYADVWGYDALGRILKESYYDGETEVEILKEYAYAGLKTTVTTRVGDPGDPSVLETEFYKDIFDQLVTVKQKQISDGESGSPYDYVNRYRYNGLGNLLILGAGVSGMNRYYGYDGAGQLIQANDPENGERYYYYDSIGNMISMKDSPDTLPEGYWHAWDFDEAGREKEARWKDKEATPWHLKAQWKYDKTSHGAYSKGKLCLIRNFMWDSEDTYPNPLGWVCTNKYYYPSTANGGRIAYEKLWMYPFHTGESATPLRVDYTYNDIGKISSMQYPRLDQGGGNFPTVNSDYSYGYLRNLSYTVNSNTTPLIDQNSGITYDLSGKMKVIPSANTVTTTYIFDGRHRPDNLVIGKPSPAMPYYISGLYGYDNSGNLISRGDDEFEYDKLSRLTSGTIYDPEEGGSWLNMSYEYDRFGNMLSREGGSESFERTYTKNKMDNFIYDYRGNLVQPMGLFSYKYTYDYDNHQAGYYHHFQQKDFKYEYAVDGLRVKKVEEESDGDIWTTYYIRGYAGQVLTEFVQVKPAGGGPGLSPVRTKDYVILNGENFVLLKPVPGGGFDEYYYHNDHLGSPLELTDENGDEVEKYRYFPFGGLITGKTIGTNSHLFTGKERDGETGLDYFEARYFGQKMCRFLSCDKLGGKPHRPQTWNKYVYCLNNPMISIDPDGLDRSVVVTHVQADQPYIPSSGNSAGKEIETYLADVYHDGQYEATFRFTRDPYGLTLKDQILQDDFQYGNHQECPPGEYAAFYHSGPNVSRGVLLSDSSRQWDAGIAYRAEGPIGSVPVQALRTWIILHAAGTRSLGCLTSPQFDEFWELIEEDLNNHTLTVTILDRHSTRNRELQLQLMQMLNRNIIMFVDGFRVFF